MSAVDDDRDQFRGILLLGRSGDTEREQLERAVSERRREDEKCREANICTFFVILNHARVNETARVISDLLERPARTRNPEIYSELLRKFTFLTRHDLTFYSDHGS